MLPILVRWHWGGATIRLGSFSFLIFCGVLGALLILLRRAREIRLSPRDLLPVLLGSLGIGFLGARLGYFLQCGGEPFRGGLVLYGGLLAGVLAGILAARWKGLPVLTVADLAVPGVFLATSFGRMGCLFAGCCYGVVRERGLSYPPGSHAFRDQLGKGLIGPDAPESLPTVPIVLFEAVVLGLLFLITSLLWRRRLRPGAVLGAAGVLYPAWRFVAEAWRADNLPYWPWGLTFSQGISVAVLTVSALWLLLGVPRTLPATLPTLPVRPASPFQILLLLALPALSLGGISCGSHQASEPRESSGVHVYRKSEAGAPESAGRKPSESKHEDKDSNDWFGDCIADCTGDCIDDCIDATCQDSCSSRPAGGEGDSRPFESVLGAMEPGKKYKGSLSLEAVVNKRLEVLFRIEGRLIAWKAFPDGRRPVQFRVKKVELLIGDARWAGSGDLELEIGPTGDVRLLKSTLPAELMKALAALDKLGGNLLRGLPPEQALEDLSKVVQEELAVEHPKAEFSLVTRFEGHEKWKLGGADVFKDPDGSYRLFWHFTP